MEPVPLQMYPRIINLTDGGGMGRPGNVMFARIATPFVLSVAIVAGALAASGRVALAQTSAAATTAPMPPAKPANADQSKEPSLGEKEKTLSAKQLFGSVQLPSIGKAVSIGYYPRGCLAGGVEFPITGSTWQV